MTTLPADIYHPEQWREFFVMVGGGAAALTGLVFVAMSINLRAVFHDPTHTRRAIGTLAGFMAVFVVCALGLMGDQSHVWLGLEWLIPTGVAGYIYVWGIIAGRKEGGSGFGVNRLRIATGTSLYVLQMVGAVMLVFGQIAGLYLAATAMIVYIPYMITGAWLLLVGVVREQRRD